MDLPDEPSKRAVQPAPESFVKHGVLADAQVRMLERKASSAAGGVSMHFLKVAASGRRARQILVDKEIPA